MMIIRVVTTFCLVKFCLVSAAPLTDSILETIPETIPDTIPETILETIPETIPETIQDTIQDTIQKTVQETHWSKTILIVETKRATPREEFGKPEAGQTVKKVFVGGLKEDMTKDDIKEYFEQFGKIVAVTRLTEKDTGKPRGFGFVEFDDYDPVDKAILKGSHQIKGKRVDVKKVVSKQGYGGQNGGGWGGGQQQTHGGDFGGGGGWNQGGQQGGWGGGASQGGQQGGWGGGASQGSWGGASSGGQQGGWGGFGDGYGGEW